MFPENEKLVELLQEKSPEQLCLEEIELLRERLVASPGFRQRVLDQLDYEEYLRDALARIGVTLEDVLAQAEGVAPKQSRFDWALAHPAVSRPVLVRWAMAVFGLVLLVATAVGLRQFVLSASSAGSDQEQVVVAKAKSYDSPKPTESEPGLQNAGKRPSENVPESAIRPDEVAGGERATPKRGADAGAGQTAPEPNDRADSRQPASQPSRAADAEQPASQPSRAADAEQPAPKPSDGAPIANDENPRPARENPAGADDRITIDILDDHSHPLAAELDKQGFNIWTELKGALEEEAYGDVVRFIRLTPPSVDLGLLPDLRDGQLLVPYGTMIRLAMNDHPELIGVMRERFDKLARLRLGTAISQADVQQVFEIAAEFYGTQASAEANRWLGDRAVSGGDFPLALSHYRQALSLGPADLRNGLAARIRLVGAMMGQDFGEPVAEPVQWGRIRLSPVQFERMVAEQREQNILTEPTVEVGILPPSDVPPAPAPTRLATRFHSEFPAGLGTPDRAGAGDRDSRQIDFPAWGLSAAGAGQWMILSNRQYVGAVDMNTGDVKWLQDFGARGGSARWNWIPMRPLVAKDRVYARRISGQFGPELVCLETSGGRVLWASRPGHHVASQPLLSQDVLLVLAAIDHQSTGSQGQREETDQQMFQLTLTGFNPHSGQVLFQLPLVRLRDKWHGMLPCRATVAGDVLLATVGGVVVCIDGGGNVRWLRRQPWEPVTKNRGVPRQYHGPPLVADGRIFPFQPGVRAMQCLDLGTGRILWENELAGITRLVGVVRGQLVVQADRRLVALNAGDGSVSWQCPLRHPMQAYLCGGPGDLAYVDYLPVEPGNLCPTLIWLDPSSGKQTAKCRLEELIPTGRSPAIPRLGPILSVDGRLFLGRESTPPNVRQLVELVPTNPLRPFEKTVGAASM